ncbi:MULTISPECIES: 2,3-bisphosphoglycerate-independent phosphoglycerate mutase [unclassified Oceanobacter]|uniref:2,3-bisphosphoglycerate-independent phosphoglycerate mutase n=1 Tax=unclassified Oceanobacter TaxID=2620260 RepID=UPI00273754F4|nr:MULTISPECIES: 2,3-bisphosphoglycerate-independent phosphoglycerate mutase [unclassified Oceanobacter]MDP2505251.1 2,3-bisphosphoglycerate-independent phosphoglycerate mutase [Oceanobacter sp. 3_MG-2023]MDP2549267.1 2,3-bisphosphoglycerate-independent phosphoglycerate mutase [Oceanobacter sp. 4_MG-2023]MDP2607924.1 2,3-bisphosphoglycerate-independent phosphoglycerate mutase [Oceanobacter sp. 1_MG-2023]MDP2611414.1 2,3-bisphosphoglycerate-independent phosphoglycerate mutase [Oceanobacter sp. 2
MNKRPKPVALIILDGWGYRAETDNNAIANANTPTWDRLLDVFPNTLIQTSGEAVGLPDGQMGNSEVGHMNLGAGRIVYQNFTRINKAIVDGELQQNPALVAAMDKAKAAGGAVHFTGLLSPGGVHSHEDHLVALLEMAHERGIKQVCVTGILDGRDTPPRSAADSIAKIEAKCTELGNARLTGIVGRYFAMDRDNRWERVQTAYDLMTTGNAQYTASNGSDALQAAYERDENDEFVTATLIGEPAPVQDGDAIICFNFRPDRSRELTRAFVEGDEFNGFDRALRPALSDFVMLTEYAASIDASCAFPPEPLSNGLGEYIANQGMKQLRIAETEKYAHVTFFFSGGQETEYDGETRILVNSPSVATYDLQPEMSAPEVTEKLVDAIKHGDYDLIVCNYANGDMVGHTGIMDAAVKAAEAIDTALEAVTSAILEVGGECLITADHGNAEQMLDDQGRAMTQHTTGPVNLVYVNEREQGAIQPGRLCDIAPTLLAMMGLEQPAEMTGNSLVDYS